MSDVQKVIKPTPTYSASEGTSKAHADRGLPHNKLGLAGDTCATLMSSSYPCREQGGKGHRWQLIPSHWVCNTGTRKSRGTLGPQSKTLSGSRAQAVRCPSMEPANTRNPTTTHTPSRTTKPNTNQQPPTQSTTRPTKHADESIRAKPAPLGMTYFMTASPIPYRPTGKKLTADPRSNTPTGFACLGNKIMPRANTKQTPSSHPTIKLNRRGRITGIAGH